MAAPQPSAHVPHQGRGQTVRMDSLTAETLHPLLAAMPRSAGSRPDLQAALDVAYLRAAAAVLKGKPAGTTIGEVKAQVLAYLAHALYTAPLKGPSETPATMSATPASRPRTRVDTMLSATPVGRQILADRQAAAEEEQ